MSISFSGLSSGIDTSSWVESLVSIKQAKLSTVQSQKSEVVALQDTLLAIKSFFSSFKDVLGTITDSSMGLDALDVFSKKIANSSNTGILSAIVSNSAEEGTYSIQVEQLATKTTATSGYVYTTDVVSTTSATSSSKLADIGMEVSNGESIKATAATKLSDIGVAPNFANDVNQIKIADDVDSITIDGETYTVARDAASLHRALASDENVILANDIDMSGYSWSRVGTGWGYTKIFDGNGYVLKNYNNTRSMFENLYGAEIKNLGIENARVATSESGGILTVSINLQTKLTNCYIADSEFISTRGEQCGIFGAVFSVPSVPADVELTGLSVFNSRVEGWGNVGGIIQFTDADTHVTMDNCNIYDSTVVAGQSAGGLCGYAYFCSTDIMNSNVVGCDIIVNGKDFGGVHAGGISGLFGNGSITNCNVVDTNISATDPLDGQELGGLIGRTSNKDVSLTITSCTSQATMSGRSDSYVGAVIGYNFGSVNFSDCSYDSSVCSLSETGRNTDLEGVTAVTSLQANDVLRNLNGFVVFDNDNNYVTSIQATKNTNLSEIVNAINNALGEGTAAIENGVLKINGGNGWLSGKLANDLGLGEDSFDSGVLTTLESKASKISVKNNGITKNIELDKNDTIDDLVRKFKDIGVEASFDAKTGVFSINAGLDQINEYDTGFIEALKLKNIEAGYVSKGLEVVRSTTNTEIIDGNTKLNTLTTLTSNQDIIVKDSYGRERTVVVETQDTINQLVAKLEAADLTASYTDGVLTIQNGAIVGGSFDIEGIFGLSSGGTSRITSGAVEDSIGTLTLGKIISAMGTSNIVYDGYNLAVNGEAILVNSETTLSELEQKFSSKGVSLSITGDNKIDVTGTLTGNVALALGIDYYDSADGTHSKTAAIPSSIQNPITDDTLLSDLGITNGDIVITQNGKTRTVEIDVDDLVDINGFNDLMHRYGINSHVDSQGRVVLEGGKNLTLEPSATNSSNILTKLKLDGSATTINTNSYTGRQLVNQTTITDALPVTDKTLLSEFNTESARTAGKLVLTVDGLNKSIFIEENDTVESLASKLNSIGLDAGLYDNKFKIFSKDGKEFSLNSTASTSKVFEALGITEGDVDLSVSNSGVLEYNTSTVRVDGSVSNFISLDKTNGTKLSDLNVTSGSLTIYKDGYKQSVFVDSTENFGQLAEKLDAIGISMTLDSTGKINLKSKDGSRLNVGSSLTQNSDTGNTEPESNVGSNIASVLAWEVQDDGSIRSIRSHYRVNENSKIMDSGLFKAGQVTEGSFTIGADTFTIGADTTVAGLIDTINRSQTANVIASWDSIEGKFVITSKLSGSSLINIEAGIKDSDTVASNFTEIMGLTSTNSSGQKVIRTDMQALGTNARFTINGTHLISTSNSVGSDITGIQGVTINLKEVSEGKTVTLRVEKDAEVLYNAVADVVDKYNALMENVDAATAVDGKLKGESTLKALRNQIRSTMMKTFNGSSLGNIGIATSAASSGNVSTNSKSIVSLKLDKDAFLDAFKKDPAAVKNLLLGESNGNKGIFAEVEGLVERTLNTNGYFDSANKAYNKKISNYDTKILNGTQAISRYRARLEKKFAAMDSLISRTQNQYSSFL